MHNAQNDILEDLSKKKGKMGNISYFSQNHDDLNEIEKQILYILGQHYILGIEGTGLTMKELESALEVTEYVVRKSLKNFETKEFVTNIKLKPIEVAISPILSNILI